MCVEYFAALQGDVDFSFLFFATYLWLFKDTLLTELKECWSVAALVWLYALNQGIFIDKLECECAIMYVIALVLT